MTKDFFLLPSWWSALSMGNLGSTAGWVLWVTEQSSIVMASLWCGEHYTIRARTGWLSRCFLWCILDELASLFCSQYLCSTLNCLSRCFQWLWPCLKVMSLWKCKICLLHLCRFPNSDRIWFVHLAISSYICQYVHLNFACILFNQILLCLLWFYSVLAYTFFLCC